MLEKLRESHRQMQASAARLSLLIDADTLDAEALQAARWDIGTRIMQHLALEDKHVFGNLAKDTEPELAALGRQYQLEFREHVAFYAEHAKSWTAERVAADWHGYRVVTRKQLQFLAGLIRKVEREVFPLCKTIPVDTPQQPSTSWTREAFAIKDCLAQKR